MKIKWIVCLAVLFLVLSCSPTTDSEPKRCIVEDHLGPMYRVIDYECGIICYYRQFKFKL